MFAPRLQKGKLTGKDEGAFQLISSAVKGICRVAGIEHLSVRTDNH